jgi:2-polyprenyl-3-methyl-5-hydroxy-6-metoxy-1,4-benzoquinol methylase
MNCLLCDSNRTRPIWQRTGKELRQLYEEAGHSISDQAYGMAISNREINLFHCDACGFEFFDPALAGSGEFYEELDSGTYYPPERPEFAFALEYLTAYRAQSVLDIGGGDGAFLDLARSMGMKTYGLELNQAAAAIARTKGHFMLSEKLESIPAAELHDRIDAITLFQVLEHVPNPHEFLSAVVERLRPGGLVIISVPNRNGVFKLLFLDPANLPPHHITRWRAQDLEQLGSAHGLTWICTSADVLYGRGIASFWHLQNRLARAIGQKPIPGGRWVPELVSFFYRKLGCRYFFPRWGLSVYAAFQKKSSL